MAARLLLVAAALLHRLADRFAIGNRRGVAFDRDLVLAFQPLAHDPQMHLAMARQHGLGRVLVVAQAERGIFLGQALDGRRHLDLVLALLRPQREGKDRLRRRQREQRLDAALGGAQRLAGLDLVQLAQRHRVAGLGGGELGLVLAEHLVDARDFRRLAVRQNKARPHRRSGRRGRATPTACRHARCGWSSSPGPRSDCRRGRRAVCGSPRHPARHGGSPSAGAARHCPFRRCRSAPALWRRRAGRRRGRRRPRPSGGSISSSNCSIKWSS